jgi:hypothetical protein
MSHCAHHVSAALTTKHASQKVASILRGLEISAALSGLSQSMLDPLELLGGNDRGVAVVLAFLAPMDLTQINSIAQDARDLLLGK